MAAMDIWARENETVVKRTAEDPRVVAAVERLVDAARRSGESRDAILAAPEQAELRELMDVIASAHGYTGWGSQTISGFMLANATDENIGRRPRAANPLLPRIFDGKTFMTPPILWDSNGDATASVVTMIVAAPVRNRAGEVVASLGFAINPERDFSRILNVARPGESGETYAFNHEGVLVSRSRFEDQLREIGLLPADETVTSALAIHIRAPGGNIVEGFVPKLVERARPLTTMAAEAIAGHDGSNVTGYSDYRGVPVVGAWRWLPDVAVGVATEMDVEEAYAGLLAIRMRLLALVGLLVFGAVGMFLYTFVVMRLQSEVAEAKQLGRYQIERKLGKGGMGTVYLARHALLRRPTAIKVLDGERADAEGVARFEREVQVSSSLSHPNTIEIYDYGYTPDGTFYYAMELLRGITFGTCVENDGGQPDERVVYVMKQACASLAEAHKAGLIHRDLKPSNVMLCELGGLLDFEPGASGAAEPGHRAHQHKLVDGHAPLHVARGRGVTRADGRPQRRLPAGRHRLLPAGGQPRLQRGLAGGRALQASQRHARGAVAAGRAQYPPRPRSPGAALSGEGRREAPRRCRRAARGP
jgi:hypothetical protein